MSASTRELRGKSNHALHAGVEIRVSKSKEWGKINAQTAKAPLKAALLGLLAALNCYNVDSISNPQASRRASGMYLEFLLRRAHSRRRVDRIY
jgi:hypothetical protein